MGLEGPRCACTTTIVVPTQRNKGEEQREARTLRKGRKGVTDWCIVCGVSSALRIVGDIIFFGVFLLVSEGCVWRTSL